MKQLLFIIGFVKVKFRSSPENDSINAWFARQQTLRERMGFWQYGLQVYKENDLP